MCKRNNCEDCVHKRFRRGAQRGIMDCDPDEEWCECQSDYFYGEREYEYDEEDEDYEEELDCENYYPSMC